MGNPTTYLGHALTWGKIRQLESYRIDSNTLLTYAYDAGGVRIRKGAVSYQVDGNRILRESRPAGTITYEYGNGGVCGFQYDNAKYYYEKNLQGDITGIYDASGNLKAEYVYDAWGNPVVTVDIDGIGTLNPFRYRGYYYDTETGLYYLNSRYYDPRTCRFISADILLDTRTFPGYNLFAYCLNNPVIMMDINGNITLKRIVKSIWSGVSKYYGMKSEMNEVENPLKPIDKALELIGYLESARSYFENLDKMEKANYLTMLNILGYARFGDEYEMILLDGYMSSDHYAKQVKNAAQNLIVYSYIDSHVKQILMAKTFNFEDCDYLMGISASIGANRIVALNALDYYAIPSLNEFGQIYLSVSGLGSLNELMEWI